METTKSHVIEVQLLNTIVLFYCAQHRKRNLPVIAHSLSTIADMIYKISFLWRLAPHRHHTPAR